MHSRTLKPVVENENRLTQEGGQTNEDGGDLITNESGQVIGAKSNDEHSSPISTAKEPEETIEDIEQQIENCQKKLEAFKEEKHMLFQELKKVLHDEDERKKHKDLEQKQQNDSNVHEATTGNDGSTDSKSAEPQQQQQQQQIQQQVQNQPPVPLLQQQQQQQLQVDKFSQAVVTGVKRSLPTSPELTHPDSGTPVAKHHRGPLLPNPDPPIMFGRSGVPYLGGPRRPYGARSHYGGGPRQVFHDPRFTQSHVHIQEMHGQGPPPCPITPTTPRAMTFPHLSTVPEFHGVQTFQFTSSPQMSPFVSSTEVSQQVIQPSIQGSYVSKHPADIQGQHSIYSPDMHLQLQPTHSSDAQLSMQNFGHQDFLCQPTPLFGDFIQGGGYLNLDPRHQKLEQPLKLESPPRSPAHSSRKHISRGLSLS